MTDVVVATFAGQEYPYNDDFTLYKNSNQGTLKSWLVLEKSSERKLVITISNISKRRPTTAIILSCLIYIETVW